MPIRCWALDDVDADAPDRLFPNVDALWGKAWSLTIEHVKITVAEMGDLGSEVVRVSPDNSLFLEDGTAASDVRDLATSLIRSEVLPGQSWPEVAVAGLYEPKDGRTLRFGLAAATRSSALPGDQRRGPTGLVRSIQPLDLPERQAQLLGDLAWVLRRS